MDIIQKNHKNPGTPKKSLMPNEINQNLEYFPDLNNLQKNLKGFWESIYQEVNEIIE